MSELKQAGMVKQLASDSISKRITMESTPNSDMITDLKQQQPLAQTWDQRVAKAEAEAGINKDVDPSFSYGTVEDFNIDLLDQYDIEYLRKVVIYLYKQVTQLTNDNKRLVDMAKHAAELIQEQSKQLMKQNTQLPGNKEETATTA